MLLENALEEERLSVKYGLLALLATELTHGYQHKSAFERRTGGSWALNIGQVYRSVVRHAGGVGGAGARRADDEGTSDATVGRDPRS